MFLAMPLVFVLHLAFCIMANGLQVAYSRICLRLVRKENFNLIQELKSSPKYILPLFLTNLLAIPAIVLLLDSLLLQT